MSLSPVITRDSLGVLTLRWTRDPNAKGYLIVTPTGSAIAGAAKTSANLGEHDTITVSVAPLQAGTAETTAYPPPPPPPPPPPAGVRLRSSPPGFAPGAADKSLYDPKDFANYPGFSLVDFPWLTIVDYGSKDIFFRPFDLSALASKTSGRTEGGFRNGRHIVAIGGRLSCRNTNNLDDACPLQIQGGDPTGIVHLEGIDGDTVNGVTVRTGRTVRQQNCRWNLATYQHDHTRIHPDWTQIWANLGAGSPRLQAHRVSVVSDYTGLSCLEPPDPASGELYDVDLSTVGDGIYPASGGQPHNVCKWTLSNFWFQPANGKLDDHWGYTDRNTYEMRSADGTRVYTSNVGQVGGSGGATTIGGAQGDVWKCLEAGAGLFGQECRYGVPPGGDFVPAGVPGPAYVSPGYA